MGDRSVSRDESQRAMVAGRITTLKHGANQHASIEAPSQSDSAEMLNVGRSAAYVLTDWPIIQALTRAADRGVKVRIYLDGSQLREREPATVFKDLAQTPGVEIRVKRENSALMHLKCYEIDGRVLRTGSANFSASGEKRQDNDLVVLKDAQAAVKFKHVFEARFTTGQSLSLAESN
jgi:phosphatidylserine/phosphatidylglycerophosphate/cardiolipin synthase-like enzyme